MFHINCQVPKCVFTWVLVVVAFCYDMLYELCDDFSDLLPVLLVFYVTLRALLFNFYMVFYVSNFQVLCGLDLSWLCLGI